MPRLSPPSLPDLQRKIDSLPDLLTSARWLGFLKRVSKKITPQNFLATACLFSLNSSGSLTNFASYWFQLTHQTLSKQAVQKRFTSKAVGFMEWALKGVICSLVESTKNLANPFKHLFGRILVQDSTCLALDDRMMSLFPGAANQNGQSSSLKIQGCIDLITNTFVTFAITPFTCNDQSQAEAILAVLKPKDLLIRDLGYFIVDVLKKIGERGAFFISRPRLDLKFFCPKTGQEIELLNLLRRKDQWDGLLWISREKLPVRLVAQKLPPQLAAERRRKENAKKKHGHKATKKTLNLLGWNILITNIPQAECSLETIFKLYSLRWRIEIIFKAWKQHFNFKSLDKHCSLNQLLIIVTGKLILICWFSVLFTRLVEEGHAISILKLAEWWKTHAARLFSAEPHELKHQWKAMIYYCRYEKRRRRNYLDVFAQIELSLEFSLG